MPEQWWNDCLASLRNCLLGEESLQWQHFNILKNYSLYVYFNNVCMCVYSIFSKYLQFQNIFS